MMNQLLQQAIVSLPDENQKLVILLVHQKGMTCKEISQMLGKPIGTITSWLSRGYCILRKKLRKQRIIQDGL
jgi:RNA polymerase sigma factor (sigma-70 family)